jgi:hypothetical protein
MHPLCTPLHSPSFHCQITGTFAPSAQILLKSARVTQAVAKVAFFRVFPPFEA